MCVAVAVDVPMGMAVGIKLIVGVPGVGGELAEGTVELWRPVVLGVAVVGLASVEGRWAITVHIAFCGAPSLAC